MVVFVEVVDPPSSPPVVYYSEPVSDVDVEFVEVELVLSVVSSVLVLLVVVVSGVVVVFVEV